MDYQFTVCFAVDTTTMTQSDPFWSFFRNLLCLRLTKILGNKMLLWTVALLSPKSTRQQKSQFNWCVILMATRWEYHEVFVKRNWEALFLLHNKRYLKLWILSMLSLWQEFSNLEVNAFLGHHIRRSKSACWSGYRRNKKKTTTTTTSNTRK